MRSLYIIYNIILCALLLLSWPVLLWYMYRRQGSFEGLGERLGWGWPPRLQSQAGGKLRTSWFHGASVGEVQMLVPLIQAWCRRYPEAGLLLTTMTLTGRQTAKRIFPQARVVLLPLDLPGVWPLFFRRFRPACLIIAETELWPNLLHHAARQGLPLALVNARLSLKSFKNYRFFRFFTRSMFAGPAVVVVQDQVSGQRFAELSTSPEQIVLSGNMKFDLLPSGNSGEQILYRNLFAPEIPVVVAGSTHPGEEEMILNAWEKSLLQLSETGKDACLVLAPRHPQRFSEVAEFLTLRKVDFLRFSICKESSDRAALSGVPSVLLLDTLGDLIHFYRLSRFAIIGGTLVPGIGGHNPLEAAVFAKAVIHGSYVANFKDGFGYLDDQGGGLPVAGEVELETLFRRCLQEPAFARDEGLKAAATVDRHRGAVSRTMISLEEVFGWDREDKV
ncbi:MAG: hypothetical protein J7L25_14320 [Deltaproteobacteria bacterium]|nr:hypothetical protein [Candidatus Tharpella aukensis]